MDFNYSDLQRMLLDSAERYIAERFTLEHRRTLRDTGTGLDDEAWGTFAELGWLALTAAFATAGHYTMTLAFAAAPLTVTQPVTFLQLVWATVLGAVAFDEGVDIFVIAGGALILGSVTFITWREAVLKRRSITPPSVATKF